MAGRFHRRELSAPAGHLPRPLRRRHRPRPPPTNPNPPTGAGRSSRRGRAGSNTSSATATAKRPIKSILHHNCVHHQGCSSKRRRHRQQQGREIRLQLQAQRFHQEPQLRARPDLHPIHLQLRVGEGTLLRGGPHRGGRGHRRQGDNLPLYQVSIKRPAPAGRDSSTEPATKTARIVFAKRENPVKAPPQSVLDQAAADRAASKAIPPPPLRAPPAPPAPVPRAAAQRAASVPKSISGVRRPETPPRAYKRAPPSPAPQVRYKSPPAPKLPVKQPPTAAAKGPVPPGTAFGGARPAGHRPRLA